LCADYWIADYPIAERRSPLDNARFPLEPAGLCTALSALAGAEAPQHTLESFGHAPASKVFEYFSQLTSVTHSVRPQWYRFISKDDQGQLLVEAIADIVLPGGARIYAGQPGTVVNVEEPPSQAVTWQVQVSGWALLVDILRTAAGLRSLDEKSGANNSGAVMELSVGELGIQGSASDIIAAGLKLLAAVLHPSAGLQADLFASLGSIGPPAHHILLELALAVIHSSATTTGTSPADAASILSALEVLRHLVHLPDIWQALRASAFFGSPTRRKCAAAALIQLDSRRAQHDIAVSLVRLVNALALSAMNIGHSDDTVMKGALHVVNTEIWGQFGGWRYSDIARKHELANALLRLYDSVLSHPRSAEANGFSTEAETLIDVFVTSASPLTYRPIVDVLTQSSPLIRKLVGFRRRVDAALVTGSVTSAASFLATLLRVSVLLKTAPSALPKSVLSASIATPEKGQLIDALFGLAFSPITQDTTTIALLKTLRAYLESVASDQQRPSLASMLRDAEKTCGRLANMANLDEAAEQRAAAWNLLSTIVATQPGCALFCFGASEGKVSGALKVAVEHTNAWEELLAEDPHALSATLGYVHSVLLCPSATKAVLALRQDSTFWQSVYDISIRPVPTPPTFTLSMHSEDFASRIQAYAFATQAKANATALLAAELAAVLDSEEEVETKVQSLVLGLWRNAGNLQEAAAMAVHSSCNPELHEVEGDKLNRAGVRLEGLRTVALPSEREYGRTYLYGE
jgi:nuclear pore complex protein Nup188